MDFRKLFIDFSIWIKSLFRAQVDYNKMFNYMILYLSKNKAKFPTTELVPDSDKDATMCLFTDLSFIAKRKI